MATPKLEVVKTKQHNPNMKLFAIYPDYWKEGWGEKPMLGYVRAYDTFYAVRKAYDLGLIRTNFTFGATAVEVADKPKPQKDHREVSRNFKRVK